MKKLFNKLAAPVIESAKSAFTWFKKLIAPASILDVMARQRKALLEGEQEVADEILRAYRGYERRIQGRLDAMVSRISVAKLAGEEISPNWFQQQRQFSELLLQIRSEIDVFAGAAERAVRERQRTLTGIAGRNAAELVASKGVSTTLTRVPVEQLADLVGVMSDGSPLRETFDTLGPNAARRAADVLYRTVGENPRAIAKELSSEVAGLSRDRALLIARNETNRTYRTSVLRNYRANSDVVSGWRWIAALDRRTCAICIAMHGSVHSVDEQLASHVACRCGQEPLVAGFDLPAETGEAWLRGQSEAVQREVLGKGRLGIWQRGEARLEDLVEVRSNPRWGQNRALKTLETVRFETAIGRIGQTQGSGEFVRAEFVRQVRPAQIRSALKKIESEYAAADVEFMHIIRPNGEIYRAKGTKSDVNLDARDHQLLRDAIVTHNHPARTKQFSAHDILFALDQGTRELRVTVRRYGTKRFTNPDLSVSDVLEARSLFEQTYAEALRRSIKMMRKKDLSEIARAEFDELWSKLFREALRARGVRFSL